MVFPSEGSQAGIYVKCAGFYGPEQLEKQRELGSGIELLALLKWPELVANLRKSDLMYKTQEQRYK